MTEVRAVGVTPEAATLGLSWADPLNVVADRIVNYSQPSNPFELDAQHGWDESKVSIHTGRMLDEPALITALRSPSPSSLDAKISGLQLSADIGVRNTAHGMMETTRAIRRDIHDSNYKLATITAGLGYAATKLVGRFNAPGWVTTLATMEVLQATHNPLATATANGAMVFAWSSVATNTVNSGLSRYPHVVRTAGGHFTKTTNFVANVLPGLRPETAKTDEVLHKKLGRIATTRSLRGLLAQKQLTKYIGTANYSGQSPAERRKLCRDVSTDAALASAAIYGSFAGVMEMIAPQNPELVTSLENDFKSFWAQWVLTGVIVGGSTLRSLVRRHKAKSGRQPAVVVEARPAERIEIALEAA